MKKIFTSLMILSAALSASAQNFTVGTPDGKTYADGDVINLGYTVAGGFYIWNPELQVTVNSATSVISGQSAFTVTVSASAPNQVQFCGLDQNCVTIGADPASKTGRYGEGATFPLEVDIKTFANLTAPVESTITITDTKETVTLTVNFLPTEQAGISETSAAANTLKFSGRTLHFSMESTANFSLYNISGRQVVSRSISGTGSLNLSAFPAGVYVYRCGSLTGKVLLH